MLEPPESQEREVPPEPTTRDTPAERVDEPTLPEPVFTPFSLTVGDGFKFGCGFMMALAIAILILLLIFSLFALVASLVGVPLPGTR